MPKLHPTKQLHITKPTLKKILKNYGLIVNSFQIFPGGIENTSLLISTNQGKFVLRVYRKSNKTIKNIRQELGFMKFLSGGGIAVPDVKKNILGDDVTFYTNAHSTWKCLVMEYIEGKHPRSFSERLLKELATTQATMHLLGKKFVKTQSENIPYFKNLREKDFAPRLMKMPIIHRPEVKDLLKRVKKFEVVLSPHLPHGYNHNDFFHDNILVKNNTLAAVLDFDDVGYSPMVVCLGYTLFDVLSVTKDVKKMFQYLSFYSHIRKLNKQEIHILKDIVFFRNYAMGLLEAYFFGEDGRKIKTCLKFEKIISGLKTEDFAKAVNNQKN